MAQNHQINNPLYKALDAQYKSEIAAATATIIIYFDNPVAIGEHPQHLVEMDKLLSLTSKADENLTTLNKHFNNKQI